MEKILEIKGKKIGQGKPLICVPVMAKEKEEIVRQAKQLVERKTDMIEWRVDAFSGAESPNAIREVLEELNPMMSETILVYTFRSKKQGGLLQLSPEQISDIHLVAAESGVVDFIDVEVFENAKPQKEIQNLKKYNTHVIGSHHDFAMTPDSGVIQMILEQIQKSGADVVKLALMPNTPGDVLRLLEETNRFHEANPTRPLVTMSMGAYGGISRVAGEYFGSCITFGAAEVASAPGQFPMQELEMVLEILHKGITNE